MDTSADPYCERYISNFGEREVVHFLRLFEDPAFTVDLAKLEADARARHLIEYLKAKTKNVYVLGGVDALLAQPQGLLAKAPIVTKFKQALANLPKPGA